MRRTQHHCYSVYQGITAVALRKRKRVATCEIRIGAGHRRLMLLSAFVDEGGESILLRLFKKLRPFVFAGLYLVIVFLHWRWQELV